MLKTNGIGGGGGGGQHVSSCPNVSPHSSHPDCTLEYLVSDAGSKWQLLCSLSHPTTKHLIRLGDVMNLVATHYISCTTLQLHITYGLHLPSFTALTHSHPPLHQSHSCHQSLICPHCLTTPAPHSHTHI